VGIGLISGAIVGARAVETVNSTVEAFASHSTLIAKDYLKVDADSNHAVTPFVKGFAASLGVSISAAEAIGKVLGATRAYVDGASTITVGNDADITADSLASATPSGASIAVGLAVGVGVAEFRAEVARETAAYVGTRAGRAGGIGTVALGDKKLNVTANATLARLRTTSSGFGLLAVSRHRSRPPSSTARPWPTWGGRAGQRGQRRRGAFSTDTAFAKNRWRRWPQAWPPRRLGPTPRCRAALKPSSARMQAPGRQRAMGVNVGTTG
jgi:hypothetical protein